MDNHLCAACHGAFPDTSLQCPFCGFPVILMTDATEEDMRMMQEDARQYLKDRVKDISIGIRTFSYSLDANGCRLTDKFMMKLADLKGLEVGRETWTSEVFSDVKGVGNVMLQVVVSYGGVKKEKQVQLTYPSVRPVRLGVAHDTGCTFRILAGIPNNFVSTPRIGYSNHD